MGGDDPRRDDKLTVWCASDADGCVTKRYHKVAAWALHGDRRQRVGSANGVFLAIRRGSRLCHIGVWGPFQT